MAQQIKIVTLANLQKYDALIKTYVSDADAKSIKAVAISGQKLKFYKETAPSETTVPAYEIELPERDLSNLLEKLSGATAGDVVIANADGTVADGGVKLSELATKDEVTESTTPIATSSVAGKVMIGDDFDITDDGKISLYKAVAVNSFSNNVNTVEKGRTINDVTLSWSINKVPTTLTLNGEVVSATSKSKVLTGLGLQADKTWTLKAVDARNASSQKSTSISFRNGRYWGIGDVNADGVDDAFIQGLTKELASNNTKTFTVNAGVGKYIYYASPANFGTPSFTVGGFEGGFDLIKTFDYTNASGFKESYKVWKSGNANLGNTTVVVK